jgi:diguanylate cyclase (GGDEF)-like protein
LSEERTPSHVRGEKILVVDDDPAVRMLLREALLGAGFQVAEAVNGAEALARFDGEPPDMVLLDVMMPDVNGFDVCATLRARPGGQHLPILMVTGVDDFRSINRAYEVGATDFITKPLKWLILIERVRYVLRASRTMEMLRKSEARLANAQKIAGLGSWELDLKREEFFCSEEIQPFCGGPTGLPATFLETFVANVHGEDQEVVRTALAQAVQHGIGAKFSHRLVFPDGRVAVMLHQVEVFTDDRGTPDYIAGTVQDITELKQAELLEVDRNHVMEMVIRNEPLTEIWQELMRMVERQSPDSLCALLVLRGDRLYCGASSQPLAAFSEGLNGLAIGPRAGCCGAACYFGQPVATSDMGRSPVWNDLRAQALAYNLMSCLSVPIFSGKGQILGTVALYYGTTHYFSASEHKLLEMVSKLAAVAMEQRQLNERLAHMAHHDGLTGLPNRILMADRLEHALSRSSRHGEKIALIYIDLDRFKHINDSLGHHTGDQLLQLVAERLGGATRKSDTLARMGGDEFMLVLDGISHRDNAGLTAARFLELLRLPFTVDGKDLHVGASIGISVYPDDGSDSATLQRHADIAMYHAKNQGGNRFQYFTPEMNAIVIERLEIENELRKALERQEFELHFQPQFELSERRIIGVEALIRWNHPEIGCVPPAKFIPIAEETGLILRIGEWVLNEACHKNAEWQRAGHGPFRVAVNVSTVQLSQGDFVSMVQRALCESGLEPQWLELEVTESFLMRDLEKVSEVLSALRALGVTIAIDDFGNGYSSMSYLQFLPVDCLKIDRSFINEVGKLECPTGRSRTLIRTFVSLARSLGVKILAEGVESAEQCSFLKEIGCELGQGFLFCVPVPADEIGCLCKSAEESMKGQIPALFSTPGPLLPSPGDFGRDGHPPEPL